MKIDFTQKTKKLSQLTTDMEESEIIRRLEFNARAILEDPDVTVRFDTTGLEGTPSSCDMTTKTIVIRRTDGVNTVTGRLDYDILKGILYHECGHIQFSKLLTDLEKKHAKTEDDVYELHNALNVLEDYRIEKKMADFFPAADWGLWYSRRMVFQRIGKESEMRQLTYPFSLLYMKLSNINLTKFVAKDLRKDVKKLAKKFKAEKYDELPSTEALFPYALEAWQTLKKYLPKKKRDRNGQRTYVVPVMSTTASANPKHEKSKAKAMVKGKTGKAKTKEKTSTFSEGESKTAQALMQKIKESIRLEIPETENYVKPQKPDIYTTRDGCNTEQQEDEEEIGIYNEAECVTLGKVMGRRLMKMLRLSKRIKRRCTRGKLDIKAVRKQFVKFGMLKDLRLFYKEPKLVHKHSVLVLVDFSGSMFGKKMKLARSAALMLGSCLQEMRVNYAVRGFSAKDGECIILDVPIKEFREPNLDINKLRNLYHKDGYCVNRDSDSIRNATDIIFREKGKKFIFVISDGMPNHPDGVDGMRNYNTNCKADCYLAIENAERKGVSVVGVGITEEANEFIQDVYRRGFAIDEEDLSGLPEMLVDIYLRCTKEMRE